MDLKKWIREVPDFPSRGVVFQDLSPLFKDPEAFRAALGEMAVRLELDEIDFFVGIESRGFVLGAALASLFQKGFIPLRKAGKLPPPVLAKSYKLEYGEATLEMALADAAVGQGSARSAGRRVVIVDDVLATGGTLGAAVELCQGCGFEVKDIAVLIDLCFLNQFRFQDRRVHSVLQIGPDREGDS